MHDPAPRALRGLTACLLLGLVACGPGSGGSSGASSTGATGGPPDTTGGTAGVATGAPTSTTGGTASPASTSSSSCNDTFDCVDCGEALVAIDRIEPAVLVVDKSRSMVSNTWDADADPNTPEVTRWSTVHAVVSQFAAANEDSFALGLVLSPGTGATDTYDAAACQLAVAPDVELSPLNAAAMVAALPPAGADASQIAGARPQRAALQLAYEHLAAVAPDGRGSVVLVTDGAANCSLEAVDDASRLEGYDAGIVAAAAAAHAAGITTYVVGVAVADVVSPNAVDSEADATNAHVRLGELAVAGGGATGDPQAPYDNSAGEAELTAALAAVAARAYPCTLTLDPPPKYLDAVEINLGDVGLLPGVGPCGDEAGWYYTDTENHEVELCGALCASFRETGGIVARYRCPSA